MNIIIAVTVLASLILAFVQAVNELLVVVRNRDEAKMKKDSGQFDKSTPEN